MSRLRLALAGLLAACFVSLGHSAAVSQSQDPNAAQPGPISPEPATPLSLGLRWPVAGDANGNAVIRVEYRAAGEAKWREGFPLFRIHPDKTPRDHRVPGGALFAGSLVDLEPDTAYEVSLTLTDPDGGDATRQITLHTAAEPVEPESMRFRHVVPAAAGQEGGGDGTEAAPFQGLRAAAQAAEPGDLFLLAPGRYLNGPLWLTRSGLSGAPIIYRGSGEGVILDGASQPLMINAAGLQHVWFENLTFRNAELLVEAAGARHLVFRRNDFRINRIGLQVRYARGTQAQGFFVTDNSFASSVKWPRSRGKERVWAVNLSGSGHVIGYNSFRNLGDAINNGGGGRLSASDIHNNDIDVCTDDGIEADHSEANVRVFRNRITNCFAAISAQPIWGGPLYLFRNMIYNVQYSPFKLHNHTSGILIFHNSAVSARIPFNIQPGSETVNDVMTRNNLFVGTKAPALRSTGRMIRCDFDSDGYGWRSGAFAEWNGRIYKTPAEAKRSGKLYSTWGAIKLPPDGTFADGLTPPGSYKKRFQPAVNDLRLAPGSAAIDAGVPLPNFNDGYLGQAPDLGCCEAGAPLPHFGPRPG